MNNLLERLLRIEEKLDALVEQRVLRDYDSTADVAQFPNKAEFTVRECCRLGRIHAEKRDGGQGNSRAWMISHDELQHIRSEGLLSLNVVTVRSSKGRWSLYNAPCPV